METLSAKHLGLIKLLQALEERDIQSALEPMLPHHHQRQGHVHPHPRRRYHIQFISQPDQRRDK